jgi:addiction module HigA family antidote
VYRALGLEHCRCNHILRVTRAASSKQVNGKRSISAEMAVRLSKVFGGSAESWLCSRRITIWRNAQAGRIRLKRLHPARMKDNFGQKMLALKGTAPDDIDLEF